MLFDGALAISIPARELNSARLPGSVFAANDLAAAPVSVPLALALDLVVAACRRAGSEPVFVARPEIFPHGPSLAWLVERLGGAQDHLALSDGTTVRLIPGLRNHVFFFGLARRADGEALSRLARRAPELFQSLHSQVNTALRFGAEPNAVTPRPLAIAGVEPSASGPAQLYRIAFNVASTEDSLLRTRRAGPLAAPPRGLEEVEYIPLTEAALADASFVKLIAKRLSRVYFDRARALILRLPTSAGGSERPDERQRAVFDALIGARATAPLAPAATAFFATADLAAEEIAACASVADFFADASFDFWRLPPSYYRPFRAFRLHARRRGRPEKEFSAQVAALAGRAPEVLWRGEEDDSDAH